MIRQRGGGGATLAEAAPGGSVAPRQPAVSGSFYPDDPHVLRTVVSGLLAEAARRYPLPTALGEPIGILVPHAGLEYSGVVAAAGWRILRELPSEPTTVVILGTNHRAAWLDGVGAWDRDAWRTPLGDVATDDELADAITGLGRPFGVDRDAHRGEHSIEVQLPFLQVVAPATRIVALAVSTGIGSRALDAGARLGGLLAERRVAGQHVVLAISSDMAHYPTAGDAHRVTEFLRPAILDIDAEAVAARERELRVTPLPGLACGMCGIEPTVVGLAALRAAGAGRAVSLADATSADSGGQRDHTVGYLAVAFGLA